MSSELDGDGEESFAVDTEEHSYSKPSSLSIGQEPQSQQEESISPALTPLDRTHDNFEALLLKLLQAYTMQSSQPSGNSSSGSENMNISGEALDTLSPAQISALITSNSVNYEVIQQILAQQNLQRSLSSSSSSGSSLPSSPEITSPEADQLEAMEATPVESTIAEAALDESGMSEHASTAVSSSEISQAIGIDGPSVAQVHRRISSSSERSSQSPNSPMVIPSSGNGSGANTPGNVIHITMDQLNLLQNQVQGLLQAQNISLPSEVSPDLIQSLILRQLGGAAGALLKNTLLTNSTPELSVPASGTEIKSGSLGTKLGPICMSEDIGGGKPPGRTPSNLEKKTSILTGPSSVVGGVLEAPAPAIGGYAPSTPTMCAGNAPVSDGSDSTKEGMAAGKSRGRGGGGGGGRGQGSKSQGTSRPSTLSGAAISAVQQASGSSGVRKRGGARGTGRGRGRGAGATRGTGKGRHSNEGVDSSQQIATPTTPAGTRSAESPTISVPSPFDLFYRMVLPTVPSASINSGIIEMMWSAMGQDVKQRYYDEHEKLKQQAEKALEEKLLQQQRLAEAAGSSVAMDSPADDVARITVEEPTSISAMVEDLPEPEVIEKVDLKPILPPKDSRLCICFGCDNLAVYSEDRGPRYCSYECVVNHCRAVEYLLDVFIEQFGVIVEFWLSENVRRICVEPVDSLLES